MDTLLTAEIAVNAPRYRRKSSTFIDGIHDILSEGPMAPAQLYSTMSGRLFHSGRIAIVMVGLPARGKTHICVSLARYLQWLGIKTRIFHLGDYRRATVGVGGEVPQDYFFPNASPASVMLRQKILKKCREDIYAWLNHENGQVAIYDAVNPTASGRRSLAKEFAKHDVQTLFLESYVNDQSILQENARNVKISSPDFYGMDPDEAAKRYLKRIETKIPVFESMDEPELNFIKMINAGQSFSYNDVSFNYVFHRIVFYLMNLHLKSRTTYFVRAGTTTANVLASASGGGGSASTLIDADDDVATSYLPGSSTSHRGDAPLSEEGKAYADMMTDTLLRHREQERRVAAELAGNPDLPLRSLAVWTSTRMRTVETAEPLRRRGYRVLQRSQMAQINLGVCERLSVQAIRNLYPAEVEKHEKDPYHHRYPRAESYHDLAVRLEPIILELEREQSDLLIIAHESVLRVLYAYLMHCSTMDIPKLTFPRDEIIEIIPAAYQNEAKRIHIPGLDPNMVPGSPENFRGGGGGSGGGGGGSAAASVVTPMSPIPALSTPALTMEQMQDPLEILGPAATAPLSIMDSPVGVPSPLPRANATSAKDLVADKVGDED